jgi:hypothetical protein
MKTKASISKTILNRAPLPWWEASQADPVRMLLSYAETSGLTLYSGTCKGILEDPDGKDDFLKSLCKEVKASTLYANGPIFGRGLYETWLVWPEGIIIIKLNTDEKIGIDVHTTDSGQHSKIKKIIGEHILPENVRQPVYSLATGSNGIEIIEVGQSDQDLEEENYTEEILNDFDFIIEELQRKNPLGRLILIDGEPGTGKTFFIRGIIHEILDAIFVLVPSHMVEGLSGPDLIPMLMRARSLAGSDEPIILIIEDADKALVPREMGSLGAISTLLNISDGILGSSLNIRIVCTTNAEINEIDSALKRPGRMSRRIHIGKLTPDIASRIYTRLTGEVVSFKNPIALSDIYCLGKATNIKNGDEDS